MKVLEDSVIKAYGKKIVDPRVTYEWTIEDYKNMDVGLV
jgi:hypothetical protein